MKRLLTATLVLMLGTPALAAAPARVLVLPFDAVGDSAKPWIAKALQQNLSAELSRLSSVQHLTGEHPAADVDAAVKAAADAKADYVVFGSYQTVENDLRLTGQVVDVAKKEPVAGLKATGSMRDLFGLEDVIANQVKRSLPQPVAQAGPDMLQQPPAGGQGGGGCGLGAAATAAARGDRHATDDQREGDDRRDRDPDRAAAAATLLGAGGGAGGGG